MNSNNSLKLYELASEIINKCRSKKFKISVAESCTGGLISSIITSIPGSSDVFECGFITYSNNSKRKLLNVSQNTLSLYGAVSEEVVIEMISGLKLRTQSDILLAISGIAGPGGGTKDKPEGLVWISYAIKNNNIKTAMQKYGPIGRKQVRVKSSIESLKYLLSLL
tara:strand:+ start:144 stop:641 length:498 start_codon:yes stop_codon:yes gene_type:complete